MFSRQFPHVKVAAAQESRRISRHTSKRRQCQEACVKRGSNADAVLTVASARAADLIEGSRGGDLKRRVTNMKHRSGHVVQTRPLPMRGRNT